MITLYGAGRAPYTEKVRRALLYKGVAFDFVEPVRAEDYKRWNPKSGQLPVVDVDGKIIEDSTAILFALDALYPEPPLLATDPTVATQQRQLEDWADESFLWYFMKYRRMIGEGMVLPLADDAAGPVAAASAVSPATPAHPAESESGVLRKVAAWLRAGGTWERPVTGVVRELGLRMDDLIKFLGTRPYFYSDQLSMADLGVYSMLFTMRNDSIPGAARLLMERPSLVAFMSRVEDATRGTAAS